jgi:hypothetical protein
MASIKEIIYALLNEVKNILKEYINDSQNNLKKRIKKLLILTITSTIMIALIVSFIGSASIFILIGSLKYLMTFLQPWQAWYIVGITSGIIGGLLILILFLLIRKQLKTNSLSIYTTSYKKFFLKSITNFLLYQNGERAANKTVN